MGLFCVILGLLAWVLWQWNEVWLVKPLLRDGVNLPPGHLGLPFFGEMLNFLWYFKIIRRPDEFIYSRKKRYGAQVGMYRSHLFGSPTIIVSDPTANKFVLQSDDLFEKHWPHPELVGANALVMAEGKLHKRLRKFVIDALNQPRSLRHVILKVQPRIVDALRHWASKGIIKAEHEARRVTFENICHMFASFEPGPFLEELERCYSGVVAGIRSQPSNIPGSAYQHAFNCKKKLSKAFAIELEKRKKNGSKSEDFLDALMNSCDEDGNHLQEKEVLDNIFSLLLGAYESTAISIMWALYYLSKSPHCLQRLREEHIEISKKKNGDYITIEDIRLMKYTSKVVEETIRLGNVSSVVFRIARQDVDFKGYRIPKGWKVSVWLRTLHVDPNNFDDPLNFNPDRWDTSMKPYTYQVFGLGARICPGNMLARTQLSVFLHHLCLGYKWELVNPNAKISYLPHPRPVDGAQLKFSAI
ncbi:hypothetical protein AMTRI_Chr03g53850 [Amborella trichopoda]|uniref:ent-kaurenoic acid oxidase 1 n=1 Tax=Amborella trichopoda TaxID=13333 RepID=UPI0009BDDABB|nr:ent-kaurenoic acid oxidase 1 [Amborella trichopoda]|eukprot:XP_011621727.2 ent-kaurenoic acid oxidase 1 [Amborella trichopoda]